MLSRGGLHREAGILLRDKANQPTLAAGEFEKAGDFDEALRLFRAGFLFIEAGDLLRRLGEEDAAVAEYHKAAERMIELRKDYAEAGDLMLKKTGRADLAGEYFGRGWAERFTSGRSAAECASKLVEVHALAEDRKSFWTVMAEAEEWLGRSGSSADVGRFFNTVAECARLPHLAADRGEIRDRARLGLATQVRRHAKSQNTPGTAVADLFGRSGHWSPAVVSDADFALRAALKQRPKESRPDGRSISSVRLHDGEVTAAVQAPDSGDLLVGFKDGALVHWQPETGRDRLIHEPCALAVFGLATDAAGEWLACLRRTTTADVPLYPLDLLARSRDQYVDRSRSRHAAEPGTVCGLLPLIGETGSGHELGVSTTGGVAWYDVPGLIPRAETGPASPLPPTMHLRLAVPYYGYRAPFTFQGGAVSWGGQRVFVGWMPESAPGSTLFAPPLAWLVASPTHVELAGLFDHATLYWTELVRRPDVLGMRTIPFVAPGGFRAASIWKAGHVIGVTSQNRILYLRARGNRFEEWALPGEIKLPSRAVAAFPSRPTGELLVVLEDGTLVRMPVPG
jgi:hypothetical protein